MRTLVKVLILLCFVSVANAQAKKQKLCMAKNGGGAYVAAKCPKSQITVSAANIETIDPEYCTTRTASATGTLAIAAKVKCAEDEYLQTHGANSSGGIPVISSIQLETDPNNFYAIGVRYVYTNMLSDGMAIEVKGVCCYSPRIVDE